MSTKVEKLVGCQCQIGEGPLWNEKEQALYWVDIAGKRIHRYFHANGKHEKFDVPQQVGVIGFRERGGLITAGSGGFAFWKPGEPSLQTIEDPEDDVPESRFNDGKVDRKGRFWAGTMTTEGAKSSLYRLDPDLSVHEVESGVTISNGTGWSPDNRTMYFVDSLRYTIFAYDFDLESGSATNKRPLLTVDEKYGIPDGLTVDSDGFIWCAFYAGSKVSRIDPKGQIVTEIEMPVSQPTSCIFGGPSYEDLYVTSAWNTLSDDQREREPLAGDLFVLRPGVQGIPEPDFVG